MSNCLIVIGGLKKQKQSVIGVIKKNSYYLKIVNNFLHLQILKKAEV